jgi:hypothetical protein
LCAAVPCILIDFEIFQGNSAGDAFADLLFLHFDRGRLALHGAGQTYSDSDLPGVFRTKVI